MKIRIGFVSNSSSTSFTCDISTFTDTGQDGECYENECCVCDKGHSFFAEYLLIDDEVNERLTIKEKRTEVYNDYVDCIDSIAVFFKMPKDWSAKSTILEQDIVLKNKFNNATDEQIIKLHEYLAKEGELLKWANERNYGTEHDVTSARCPICQLQELPDKIALKYLIKKLYTNSKSKLFEEIKKEFDSFDKLDKFIKEEK